MMHRRDVIAGLLVAATFGRAHAQQTGKVYRIALVGPAGVDMSATAADLVVARTWGAFFGELRRLGYVEGENLVVERYNGDGRPEHFRELAVDVVRRTPDLIYTFIPEFLLAFKAETTTIPVVGLTSNPLGLGIISNLARPGGNITGSSVDAGIEVWGKRFDLLREAIPRLSRLGFLVTTTRWRYREAELVKDVSEKGGITLVGSPLDSPVDEAAYRRAFGTMAQEGVDAVFVGDEPEHFLNIPLIVALAEKGRLPSLYAWREAVEIGGFMAYAFELLELVRHNADVIDQILKGAKPGDIPFYQARKFELVINLKTAKALGIEIPASLLALVDEVIE
jgi:putative ABC transport system substrate-binding protein